MDSEPVFSRARQKSLVVVCCIMTGFGGISVVLRLISRHIIVRKLGADDIMMLAGMIRDWSSWTRFDYSPNGGTVKVQLTYNTVIAVVKLSIVCFYLRLGLTGRFISISWITIIFLVIFYFVTQTASVLQCLPVEVNWDVSGRLKKNCINTLIYFYVVATINILIDLWILVMPINTLRRIKRPIRDKVILFLVFGIGALSCISSMIRLYTIKIFAHSKDPFFDGAPINMWSLIEVNLAIICSSVPAMKPLFSRTIKCHSSTSDTTHTFGSQKKMPLNNNLFSSRTIINESACSTNAAPTNGQGPSDDDMLIKAVRGSV